MLVQVVLQCVPAPSDTHHHMSAKDLNGKKEKMKKMRPQWAAEKKAKHTHEWMRRVSHKHTHTYTHTHTAQVHRHANSPEWWCLAGPCCCVRPCCTPVCAPASRLPLPLSTLHTPFPHHHHHHQGRLLPCQLAKRAERGGIIKTPKRFSLASSHPCIWAPFHHPLFFRGGQADGGSGWGWAV